MSQELLLPSDWISPTTNTIGAFQVGAKELAAWLVDSFKREGSHWESQSSERRDIEQLIRALRPNDKPCVSKILILGFNDWALVLNNGILGTDVGLIPSLCARELGRVALRATSQADGPNSFGAAVLEVFSPTANPPLRCRRSISAANDGGRWSFNQYGEPYSFEHLEDYRSKSIRERFTSHRLAEYLQALQVPCISAPAGEADEAYKLLAHQSAV